MRIHPWHWILLVSLGLTTARAQDDPHWSDQDASGASWERLEIQWGSNERLVLDAAESDRTILQRLLYYPGEPTVIHLPEIEADLNQIVTASLDTATVSREPSGSMPVIRTRHWDGWRYLGGDDVETLADILRRKGQDEGLRLAGWRQTSALRVELAHAGAPMLSDGVTRFAVAHSPRHAHLARALAALEGQTVTVTGSTLTSARQAHADTLVVHAIRFSPTDRPDVVLNVAPTSLEDSLRLERRDENASPGSVTTVPLTEGRFPHPVQPTEPVPAPSQAAATAAAQRGLIQTLNRRGE